MIQYPLGVNGMLTRVLEAGQGERVVLFMHGLGARADRWRRNLDALAERGLRCIAFDWPGHGLARKGPDFAYNVPGFSAYLEGLIEALGLSRVALVGTSLGGHVAAHFACRHPSLVSGLVLVGATGLMPIGRELGARIKASVSEASRTQIEAKLRFVMAAPGVVTEDLIEEEWRIANSPGAAAALARLGDYIADGVDDDCVGPTLAALAARPPLMLVWGAEDRAVPPGIGEAARVLLGLPDMTVIPGAGHAPYFERPDLFNPLVGAFLADHAPQSGSCS
jgi:2-hydroxy-6-oxonona-2,4-dienedioate hydrolase